MAALTATDWTVTVLSDRIHQKSRHIRARIQLPSAGTYPSDGIPIPAYTSFGFKRNLEVIHVDGIASGQAARQWNYDPVNGTLRAYSTTSGAGSGAEIATTVCFGEKPTFYITARGW